MSGLNVSSRRWTRAILVYGCAIGLLTYILTPLERPDQVMLASDVYRHAVGSFLAGEGLYGVHPPDRPGYTFLYPPVAIFPFLPHVLVSDLGAFALQTLLNVGAGLGTALVIYRALKRRGKAVTRVDLLLLVAVMLLSTYSAIQFINGQITLWLALALAVGFDAIDRGRGRIAGVAFAIAALFKVFPAAIGLWLIRIRAWTAIAAAVGTGIGGLVIGIVVFGPELTGTYLLDVLVGRFEGSAYDATPAPTDSVDGVHRHLAAIWPTGMRWHSLVGLGIVGALVALSFRRVDTAFHRDVAGLATIVGVLLYLPLQPLYFPLVTFPLFMLLYTEEVQLPRGILLVGVFLTFTHLDYAGLQLGLSVLPLPGLITAGIDTVAAALFSVVLPPTLGLWVLLLTCVLVQLPETEPPGPGPSAAPAAD